MRVDRVTINRSVLIAKRALAGLVTNEGANGNSRCKACCVCDRLIRYGFETVISLERLKTLQPHLKARDVDVAKASYRVKCYKTGRDQPKYAFMNNMLLSPRSYRARTTRGGKEGLGCCLECASSIGQRNRDTTVRLPRYAIANGWCIGSAPKCLTDLNEVELAIVSPARINKHVFAFQAGNHRTIKGWHSLYYNDLSHFEAVQEHVQALVKTPTISVVLVGPFTKTQKAATLKRTTVRWSLIEKALVWLKRYNHLYMHFVMPDKAHVTPIIVDDSTEEPSTGSNVEDIFEFTVYFPDCDEPETHNAGLDNQRDLMENILEDLQDPDTTTQATLVARPTKKLLSDFEGENLMMAFPLQFPYGIGSVDNDGNVRNTVAFYEHLLCLSSRHNHKPDFCLVVHNMFGRKRMVTNAFLRCVTGNGALAEQFGSIQEGEITAAAERWTNGATGSGIADIFLKKMDGTAESMAHTNGAAQRARQRMFALTGRFGAPSVFFTISPDDHFNFRVRILAANADGATALPCHDTDDVQELANFNLECGIIREQYPGLCAFDFEQVMAVTIEHLLGWNTKEGSNNDNEGVFGDLDAWAYAVEEQGRKTLHAHFLIWIKTWSSLLRRLYDETTRLAAANELAQYMDEVMTVSLTGDAALDVAVPHECTGIPVVEKCTQQDLRNLRYKHGITGFGDEDIVRCVTCKTNFSSEDITRKTISHIGIDEDDEHRKIRMQVLLMRHLSGDEDLNHAGICHLVGELHNLHKSRHTRSCFKKGNCCRMHVPNRECEKTTIHFQDAPTSWFSWTGLRAIRNLFVPEIKRSHCDAFVNVNNAHVSAVLGSNNNVICGCDGGSCMYITCYTSKNTQKEDSSVFKNVAKYLVKKMRRESEKAAETEDTDNVDGGDDVAELTRKGLSRLIGAVLLSTSAHIVSAPMAAYLVRNDSRFGFSHTFAHCNTKAFEDASFGRASLGGIDGNVFVKSNEANYAFRPALLEQTPLYTFLSNFSVSQISRHTMRFTDPRHPSKSELGVNRLSKSRLPLISHMDFSNAKHFGGHDIMTCSLEGPEAPSAQVREVLEAYAGKVLLLFHPFRSVDDLKLNDSYLLKLRDVQYDVLTPEIQEILQNVQDCRNALASGRPDDALELNTEAVTFACTKSKTRDGEDDDLDNGDEDADGACYSIMEELMADAASRPPVLTDLRDEENLLSLSTKHVRRLGSRDSGFKLLRSPSVLHKRVVQHSRGPPGNSVTRPRTAFERNSTIIKRSKKEDLFLLSLETVERRVDEQHSYLEATGTVESIKQWGSKAFGGDIDQQRAFEVIMSNFILQFHNEADDIEEDGEQPFIEDNSPPGSNKYESERVKRRRLANHVGELKRLTGLKPGSRQLICFLTGAGGSGKSQVINAVKSYGKSFCQNLGAAFTKRTIVVTALTGTAAVTIGGETTHSACSLFKKNDNMSAETVEWEDSYLVIIDEVSFASKETMLLINEKLGVLRQNKDSKYGGLCIVFAGDFSQLPPVRSLPIYAVDELHIWHEWVNVLLQLNGNHRFANDEEWGNILQMFRRHGPTQQQVDRINERVVTPAGLHGPSEEDIPANATYAVATNIDRNAVNDGIFAKHLENTHHLEKPTSNGANRIPGHTIIIRASDLTWKKSGKSREYVPFNRLGKDLLFSYCGDAHVQETRSGRRVDPFLKLYYDRPLMLNTNRDVMGSEANGTSCRFRAVRLKEGVTAADAELMRVDGYWIKSYCCSQLESIIVHNEHTGKETEVDPKTGSCVVSFPLLGILGTSGTDKVRIKQRIQITQFPFNICNATTCHKLQGATKECLVVNSFRYTDNWPYVVLSRVTERKGLFLRVPLDGYKVKGMSDELRDFLEQWVETKSPIPANENEYHRSYTTEL